MFCLGCKIKVSFNYSKLLNSTREEGVEAYNENKFKNNEVRGRGEMKTHQKHTKHTLACYSLCNHGGR